MPNRINDEDEQLNNDIVDDEEQDDEEESQGPNINDIEKRANQLKGASDKAKKAQKAAGAIKKGGKAVKGATKAAATAGKVVATGSKAVALLANPVVWIVIAVILIVIAVIGIIMSFTIMPGNFIGQVKKFVTNTMQKVSGIIWGDKTTPIGQDDLISLANYIQSMGYDVQGYGFGDVKYKEEYNEEKEQAASDYKSKDTNGVDQFESPAIAPGSGEIEKINGLEAVTTISTEKKYEDKDEMYTTAGRFSSKNNDYLRAYLSADAATYTEATYSIKGALYELKQGFLDLIKNFFTVDKDEATRDPGAVGVKAHSTGMINIEDAGGNNIFNSLANGSNNKIKIDAKNKQLIIYEHAANVFGLFKIQWGKTFSMDMSNWTAIYGRPVELFLALHLATMMPDLSYQIAVDQAFNTKVNIGLQDVNINYNVKMNIDGHDVTIGEQEIKGYTNNAYQANNLKTLEDAGDNENITLTDDGGTAFTCSFSSDQIKSLENLVKEGDKGTKIKFPYIKSVTNHWYYHIIDFLGSTNSESQYGTYKKARTAKKTIQFDDDTESLKGLNIKLEALLSSDSGIFYQVCEPFLNEEPSPYITSVFSGLYYKYDGTEDTAKKIAAARAIENQFGEENVDYDTIINYTTTSFWTGETKKLEYSWHGEPVEITSEQAKEYVSAKKAQAKVENNLKKVSNSDNWDEKELYSDLDTNEDIDGYESPMCKKPVEFKTNKSNALSSFSILEHINSEEADVNYRLLKKLMVKLDYFSTEEMNQKEKNILLWITNVDDTRGAEVAEEINNNLGVVDDEHQSLSETGRDTNEYGAYITNFIAGTKIVAPGDAKVKETGTDEHGNYIELSFTSLGKNKVYPLSDQKLMQHQNDETSGDYNRETTYEGAPLYSAADVMRNYRFKDTYQVFDDDDPVGITMRISGLNGISVGNEVTRGQVIASSPSQNDKIYITMKKADKTKIDNIEDYINPEYTYEDEKYMAKMLYYQDNPERGEIYDDNGNTSSSSGGTEYLQWALEKADDNSIGYCQEHRKYTDNTDGDDKDVDCSSFVFYALKENGYDLKGDPFSTSNMRGILLGLGFTKVSLDSLEPGDILWRSGHTEIYVNSSETVGAHSPDDTPPSQGGHYSFTSKKTGKVYYAVAGDQGEEVSTAQFNKDSWEEAYRPPSTGANGQIAKALEWMEQNSGKHGYGRGAGQYDCSSFVWTALHNAGYNVGSYAFATPTEESVLQSSGEFDKVTYTGPGCLKAGDVIIWNMPGTSGYDQNGHTGLMKTDTVFIDEKQTANAASYFSGMYSGGYGTPVIMRPRK